MKKMLACGRIGAVHGVLAALRALGYDGWLCADEESGSDLASAMTTCHRFITASLW